MAKEQQGHADDPAHDIHEGDYVGTRYRGGTREGYVEEVTAGGTRARFHTQRGKEVEHKLSTLAKDVDLSPGGSRGLSQRELQEAREEWQHETGHATGKKPIARAHSAD